MFVSVAEVDNNTCLRTTKNIEAAYIFCSLEELVMQQLLASLAWTSSKVRAWAVCAASNCFGGTILCTACS